MMLSSGGVRDPVDLGLHSFFIVAHRMGAPSPSDPATQSSESAISSDHLITLSAGCKSAREAAG